jgi:signal transduction histidine kinase
VTESQVATSAGGDARAQLREQQLVLMHDADQLILDHTNTLARTLQFIVDRVQEILNAWHVDILFGYADGLRLEISSDRDAEIGRFVPFASSISGYVLSSGRPVLVNDLQNDPVLRERYFPRTESDQAHARLSVVAAELTLDGQAIGVVNIEATPDRAFEQSHVEFANAVARQISLAITHTALFDEDNFRTATDRLVKSATRTDNDLVMRQVLDRILSGLDVLTFVRVDGADILFADPQDENRLVVAYSTNSADIGVRVDIRDSVCGEAFRGRTTVLEQRAIDRGDYRPLVEGMKCEMAIPIGLGRNGSPIGVLNLESKRENAFSNVGKALAERFARGIEYVVAMTKIRADINDELQDQFMILAADQVLNAVHRINNDVGSIRALALDLLEDLNSETPPDQADLAHRLRMITENAERALEIPDQMRRLIGTPQESADVNAQVEIGIAAARVPRSIQLVTDLAPGLPNIACTALDRAVENLLTNAVKAMRDRPGPLYVTTRLDDHLPEPFVAISVKDTGVGMTKQEIDHLFDPQQARRRGSGLGFGMTWVRSWVRRTQGLIDIQSEPGSGTTVTIRFQIEQKHLTQGGEQP